MLNIFITLLLAAAAFTIAYFLMNRCHEACLLLWYNHKELFLESRVRDAACYEALDERSPFTWPWYRWHLNECLIAWANIAVIGTVEWVFTGLFNDVFSEPSSNFGLDLASDASRFTIMITITISLAEIMVPLTLYTIFAMGRKTCGLFDTVTDISRATAVAAIVMCTIGLLSPVVGYIAGFAILVFFAWLYFKPGSP